MSLSKGNFRKISVPAMAAVAALAISACAAQAQTVYNWSYTARTGNVNTGSNGTFTVNAAGDTIIDITGFVSTTNGGSSITQNITGLLASGSSYTQPIAPNKLFGLSNNAFITAVTPVGAGGGIQAFSTIGPGIGGAGTSSGGVYFTTDFKSNGVDFDNWFFAYNGTSPGYWTLTDMSTGGGGTGNFAVTLLPEINGDALPKGVLLLACMVLIVGRRNGRGGGSASDATDA